MSIPRLSPDGSLVNLSNSLLRALGISGPHLDSLPKADEILARDQNRGKPIAFLMVEGLSASLLKRYRRKAPFLSSCVASTIEAVYPTTSLVNGISFLYAKYPMETGFIGDVQHFPRIGQYIDMSNGSVVGPNGGVGIDPRTLLKPETILDYVNAKTRADAASYVDGHAFRSDGRFSSGRFFTTLEERMKMPGNVFVMGDWPELSRIFLAGKGVRRELSDALETLDRSIQALSKRNPEYVIAIAGDHGWVKAERVDIRKQKDFFDTLVDGRISLCGRFASFRVKEGARGEFEKAFRERYSKDFERYAKDQIYRENAFGYGSQSALFDEFLGDEVLIAKKGKVLDDGTLDPSLRYACGGATREERILPLIFLNAGI